MNTVMRSVFKNLQVVISTRKKSRTEKSVRRSVGPVELYCRTKCVFRYCLFLFFVYDKGVRSNRRGDGRKYRTIQNIVFIFCRFSTAEKKSKRDRPSRDHHQTDARRAFFLISFFFFNGGASSKKKIKI